MRPADLALMRLPGPPTLSPDGRLVAVALTRLDLVADEYRSTIVVAPTDGSAPPRPFTFGPRDTQPRWSPDGRWLALLRAEPKGKPQLYVMAAAGGEPRRLAEHPLGVSGPVWSPDSTRIGYVARVPAEGRYGTAEGVTAEQEPPRRITSVRYRWDDVGFVLDRRPHLFVVALGSPGLTGEASPDPVQLTSGDFDDADPAWSPDGRQLAFVSARHDGWDRDLAQDLFLVPAGGGEPTRVTRTATTAAQPAFGPDGATLYYLGTEHLDLAGRTTGLWSVPTDGSAVPRRRTEQESHDLADARVASRITADRDGVLGCLAERGALVLARFPSDGGPPVRLVAGPRQVVGFDTAGGVIAVTVGDGASAGEVATVPAALTSPAGVATVPAALASPAEVAGQPAPAELVMLTNFGTELARGASLRPMVELYATAPDGYPVHGWLVRPTGTGPFPVLLVIHGGPFTQFGHFLFDEAQVYAGAGYAVVLANPRGASGYGQAHGRAIVADLGNLDAADLLALLEVAVADPGLDGTRVGVMGGSYGGYMTAWLVAHTDRFTAAVAERGLYAADSFTGSSDIGWAFTDHYLGTDPARVAAQSPLSHVEAIRTPTLIVHSEQDWRCPLEQAQRLFVALKSRGVDTELLLFPGEGHELSRSGLPSHRLARLEAVLAWWARHLGGPDAATAATVPATESRQPAQPLTNSAAATPTPSATTQ